MLRGGCGGEWGPFTHSVESLIRIYHILKETIYFMKIQNNRNWLEKKDFDFFSTAFDTEFPAVHFSICLIFKVTFSRVKCLKKVSGLPLHRKAAAAADMILYHMI